jgi:hypothetical protein
MSQYKILSYLKFFSKRFFNFSTKIMSLKHSSCAIKCTKIIKSNTDINIKIVFRYGVVHPLLFEPFPSLITTKEENVICKNVCT